VTGPSYVVMTAGGLAVGREQSDLVMVVGIALDLAARAYPAVIRMRDPDGSGRVEVVGTAPARLVHSGTGADLVLARRVTQILSNLDPAPTPIGSKEDL
jgi:hypothetical protein